VVDPHAHGEPSGKVDSTAQLRSQMMVLQKQVKVLQKQMNKIAKKVEELEKEKEKDSGNPIDLDPLVALQADELENTPPAIREENRARQEKFNDDLEDRMSRLYTHVAGLDERIAAQEKNHDRTEGFNAASLSTRKSRE